MQAIFTIITKNYLGLAMVLEKSVKANSTANFYIIVADELDEANKPNYNLNTNVLFAKDILNYTTDVWNDLSFKYSLVEFCTAIKPSCFQYFFDEKKYDKVVYLDPDVFVFNPLASIFDALETTSILLTPHIVTMQTPFKGDYPDHLFLLNGTFNLGFIGLKKSETTNSLLVWWQNRLLNDCFADNDKGTLTDQKWMNLLPAFFEPNELTISKNIGLNLAPWNYFEREIVEENNCFYVSNRVTKIIKNRSPLIFVHFSGYNYKSFSNNTIEHTNQNFTSYPDLQPIFNCYANALKEGNIEQYMQEKYTYNYFENGVNIIGLHRRIYRSLINDGIALSNPFLTNENSFFNTLKAKKLIDYAKTSADNVSNKNLPAFDNKLKLVYTLFRLLKFIIGVRKYSMFIRFLKRFAKEENQTFLIDKSFGKKLK